MEYQEDEEIWKIVAKTRVLSIRIVNLPTWNPPRREEAFVVVVIWM